MYNVEEKWNIINVSLKEKSFLHQMKYIKADARFEKNYFLFSRHIKFMYNTDQIIG